MCDNPGDLHEDPMSDLLDFLWKMSQERQRQELRRRLDQARACSTIWLAATASCSNSP
jgi:hypothetical protein